MTGRLQCRAWLTDSALLMFVAYKPGQNGSELKSLLIIIIEHGLTFLTVGPAQIHRRPVIAMVGAYIFLEAHFF